MICIALLLYINSKALYINYNKLLNWTMSWKQIILKLFLKIKRLLQVLIAMNESERRCDPQVLRKNSRICVDERRV